MTTSASTSPQLRGPSRRQMIGLLITAGALPAVGSVVAAPPAAANTLARIALETPLRDLDKPGLTFTKLERIARRRHRITFYRADWDGPEGERLSAIVRDIEVRGDRGWVTAAGEDQRFDDQWVVISGDSQFLTGGNYYPTGTPHWLAMESIRRLNDATVELTAGVNDVLDLTVRWTITATGPQVQWSLQVHQDAAYVVGYQGAPVRTEDEVVEVLCGSRQHAKNIGEATAIKAWELFAPMSLVETEVDGGPLTTGVYIPADVLEFEHERFHGDNDQPFAMSLRNESDGVQPVAYAPSGGVRSVLTAGESIGYAFGVVASAAPLYDTQVAVSRTEYDFDRYRQNVYDTSLTDTVHNIMDLVAVEPEGDDSVDFVPSVSGWWNRGKGFCNIEGDQQVRTATGSALLSANLLASRPEEARDFWDRRARPLMEHMISRRNIGYSPKPGFALEAPLAGWVGDANTITPLWELMRGQAAGIHAIALETVHRKYPFQGRNVMSIPISAYLLTGDEAWRAQALEVGKWYARHNISTPYDDNPSTGTFGYSYVRAWLELFVIYEMTGDAEILEAAYREAQRFMGLFEVRPVPDITITSPVGEPIDDMYYKWVTSPGLPDYPRDTPIVEEDVPAWMASTTGLTFEQLSTYLKTPGGGFTLNPIWAPFLLRLAETVGDDFMRDMAHNMVVGRFTNYPGYYNRQFVTAPMRPEYPIEGPPGTSCIYFHHAPAQLGLAMDYLVSEHQSRSNDQILFPSAFEVTFVYFRFRVYGHKPGTFYGDEGVWPYFPKGIVEVSNPQLNWLTAVSEDAFYLSVTNETDKNEGATVTFDPALTGIDANGRYDVEIIRDNGKRQKGKINRGRLNVRVSAHGITAVKIPGAGRLQPWHHEPEGEDRSDVAFHFDDFDGGGGSTRDRVRGISLPRPDRSGYDVYIQSSAADGTDIVLNYRVDDGEWVTAPEKVYPYEWTIGVDSLTSTFTYRATIDGAARPERTLRLPSVVTGALPAGQSVGGDLLMRPSTTPGDPFEVTARVRNTSDTTIGDVEVIVYARTGWTVEPIGPAPTELAAGEVVDATFRVTPPATAPSGPYEVTGSVRWEGSDEQALTPGSVTVFPAIDQVECAADTTSLDGPGGSITVRLTLMNRSPLQQTGTATVALPTGWTAEVVEQAWTLEGRSLGEYTFTLTATDAEPDSGGTITVRPGAGLDPVNIPVSVGDPTDVVIGPGGAGYKESGNWLNSSLDGPDGSSSRYNPEGLYGGQITWTPQIVTGGEYSVAVWYPTNDQTTEDALFEVIHPGGIEEIHVNQRQDADQWRSLGTYELEPGQPAAVRLTAISGLYTRAHSARFTLAGEADPPQVEVTSVPVHADPGTPGTLVATVTAAHAPLESAAVTVTLPEGWTVEPEQVVVDAGLGESTEVTFTVTPAAGAATDTLYEGAVTVAGGSDPFAGEIGSADDARSIWDNHSGNYREAGTWYTSSLAGHDGRSSRWAHGSDDRRTATWTDVVDAAGRYLVSVWYGTDGNTTRAASYEVALADGTVTRVEVDQRWRANTWRPLGFFDLDPATATVALRCARAGHHRVNGLRLSRVQPLGG